MRASEAFEYRQRIERAAALQTDAEALESVWMFPAWGNLVGLSVDEGVRFQYNGELWKTRQTTVVQEHYPPSVNTASLYVRVAEDSAGSENNPIPFELNMELVEGKYYTQYGVTYRCKEALNACYWDLSGVTGRYVEVVEAR